MGRVAAGVRGIKIKGEDRVIGMGVVDPKLAGNGKLQALVIMENGYGKRTSVKEYKEQGRGGQGVRTARRTART